MALYPISDGEPSDEQQRLGAIAERMLDTRKADAESREGDMVIILMASEDSGATVTEGYGDRMQAAQDMMDSLSTMLEAMGIGMQIVKVGAN